MDLENIAIEWIVCWRDELLSIQNEIKKNYIKHKSTSFGVIEKDRNDLSH